MDVLDIVKQIRSFDFSSYLEKSKAQFVGRQWMYRDLEDKITRTNASGIILVGEPGWGKTAFLSNGVCSPTSSDMIYSNTLAYHFCIYNEPLKHHPGHFTRNLVSMLINRVPEYGRILTNDSFAIRKLDSCIQDPLECFEMAVVKPLQKVVNIPLKRQFVIIDAIDECHVNDALYISLIRLLSTKVSSLPDWIKFIASSRNFTGLKKLKRRFDMIELKSHEAKNAEDIENYLYVEAYKAGFIGSFIFQASAFLQHGARSTFTSQVLEISHGNFLVAKELLSYALEKSSNGLISFPSSLCEIYEAHIERLTDSRGGVRSKHTQRILEILVATTEALSPQVIHEIMQKSNFSIEYDDIVIVLKELNNYLIYDKDGGVKLYHQSFADCLGKENMGILLRKKRGNNLLVTYYCDKLSTNFNMSIADFHDLFLSCLRQLSSADNVLQRNTLKEIRSLPHSLLNASDNINKETILHKAIFEVESDKIICALVKIACFRIIDVQDQAGQTPTFKASAIGKKNLLTELIRLGSNINLVTFPPSASDYQSALDIVAVAKEKFWEATSLHSAAWRGHLGSVSVLLDNGALIHKHNWVNATAIELACERGYLSIVELLHRAGSDLTQKCLHHASREGHFDVVSYLLDNGMTDSCIPCNEKLEWMPQNYTRIRDFSFVLELIEHNATSSSKVTKVRPLRVYDDYHLLLCRTSLFSAVENNHKNVVQLLAQRSTKALSCADYSGRFPIHEAAFQNNTEIMSILVQAGANLHTTCTAPQMLLNWSNVFRPEEVGNYYNSLCRNGTSVVALSASVNAYTVFPLLLQQNVNLSSIDDFGDTPLHIAACWDSLEFIHLLCNYGIDIEQKNTLGATALHKALRCGAYRTVDRFLRYYRANVSQVDHTGNNVFHYSVSFRKPKLYCPLGFWQLAKFKKGVAVPRSANFDSDIDSLLLLAVYVRFMNLTNLVNSRNDLGKTALHVAAENGFVDEVNVLLQVGAESDIPDYKLKLPISYAIEKCSQTKMFYETSNFTKLFHYARSHELVVLLLANASKLDPCICLNRNESLLYAAVRRKAYYAARALLYRGFNITCPCGSSESLLDLIFDIAKDGKCVPDLIPSKFVPNFEIQCGLPFERSLAHGAAFFPRCGCCNGESILLKAFLESLRRLPDIDKILNTCKDKEGYLVLHRAIQAGNFLAFQAISRLGTDVNMKGPNGIEPLYLSFHHHFKAVQLLSHVSQLAESGWEIIALHIIKKKYFKGSRSICKKEMYQLSVFHMAAAYGMPSLVENLLTDSTLSWRISSNCPNAHNVTPLYLANVFKVYNPGVYNITISLLEKYGASLIYPDTEAEYTIAFSVLFGTFAHSFNLSVNENIVNEILIDELNFNVCSRACNRRLGELRNFECRVGYPPLHFLRYAGQCINVDHVFRCLVTLRKRQNRRQNSLSKTASELCRLFRFEYHARALITADILELAILEFQRILEANTSSNMSILEIIISKFHCFRPCSFLMERIGFCVEAGETLHIQWPVKYLITRGSYFGTSYRYLHKLTSDLQLYVNYVRLDWPIE